VYGEVEFRIMSAMPLSISSAKALSPLLEMGAYEALWSEHGATFKTIAEKFRANPAALASDLVQREVAFAFANRALKLLIDRGVTNFGLRVHGDGEYPAKLREAIEPLELLYFRGWWDLVAAPSVAVVGTRKPSRLGEERAAKMARLLVKDGYTVVSGLARGIDTVALNTALQEGGRVIAVIGTPICDSYPPENASLQERIAREFLLISQVPVCRYYSQSIQQNRLFFPERNKTMSALTLGTVIIEAGETSGTLTQAQAAIKQGRKLFILDNCFLDDHLTWPKRFESMGAIRVRTYEDIKAQIAPATVQD
jgi:DNA processing protein